MEKLDRDTLEWISEKVYNMIMNNFALYCGEKGDTDFTDYGRGRDMAFRDVLSILSACIEHQKVLAKKDRERVNDMS
jgi:hypothetical protein